MQVGSPIARKDYRAGSEETLRQMERGRRLGDYLGYGSCSSRAQVWLSYDVRGASEISYVVSRRHAYGSIAKINVSIAVGDSSEIKNGSKLIANGRASADDEERARSG